MMVNEVTDKQAEVGIKLNNILTSLILMVMLWVGWSINDIRASLVTMKVDDAVMTNEINHLHKEVELIKESCDCLKDL